MPTVADLYSAPIAHVQLALMTAAVAGLAAGVLAGSVVLVRLAAVLFAAGVALFAGQVVGVARGTRPGAVPAGRRSPSPVSP